MEKIAERFLKYVSYDTQSKEDSESFPSTIKQLDLARYLCEELKALGMESFIDNYGYVYGRIRSNSANDVSKVGFIAHMDTSPEVSGTNIKPKVIPNYDGKDINLNEKDRIILSPQRFKNLLCHVGEDLIVTDGTTLLGADDKAGIAEIVQAMGEIISEKSPHGEVFVAFTPDEEVGRGTDHFNLDFFKADFAYTLDGEGYGIFEYENFNAASAHFDVKGINTHPGIAKGSMKNAVGIASEVISCFPKTEIPEVTDNYEGFYHFYEIKGGVQEVFMKAIIRDHDKLKFEEKKRFCRIVEEFINKKYGDGTIQISIDDSYYNMKEVIEKYPQVIELAKKAFLDSGLEFKTRPIRGGTDGAKLTYKGLPTPNIFSGGQNLHSIYEFVSIKSMIKAVEVIKNIVRLVETKQ